MDFLNNNRKLVITVITIFCLISAVFTVDRAKPSFIENTFGFVIAPIQKFNTKSIGWIKNKTDYFKGISELQKANIDLTTKLNETTAQLNMLRLVEDENQKLSALIELNNKYSEYPMIGANIIAKDPGNWYNIFIIDKGSNVGLEKDMVVLTADGLVGRIKECGYNYSKVISIIDDSDAVCAKSLRTDDTGYVKANLSSKGMCKMDYVDNSAEIINGDEIVTSHLSKIFPPGLTIGYVKDITTDTNSLTKCALIQPAVDFKHLDTVLVINQLIEHEYIEAPTETTTIPN